MGEYSRVIAFCLFGLLLVFYQIYGKSEKIKELLFRFVYVSVVLFFGYAAFSVLMDIYVG